MKNLSSSDGKRSRHEAASLGEHIAINVAIKHTRQGRERRYADWIEASAIDRKLTASLGIACLSLFLVALPGCAGNPPVQPTSAEQPVPGMRSGVLATEYSDPQELISAIQRKVKANMVLPKTALPEDTRIDVSFTLSAAGEVLDPQITRSSGEESVDRAVVRAVRRAAPLPILSEWKALKTPQRITLVAQPFQRPALTP